MLKFTSVSASVRAITEDITLTVTPIRTGTTLGLIIDPITGRTTGMAGIVIIAITTVIPIVTGTSLTRNSHTGLARLFRASLIFRAETSLRSFRGARQAVYFLTLAKAPVWTQGFCPAHRSGILFSTAE